MKATPGEFFKHYRTGEIVQVVGDCWHKTPVGFEVLLVVFVLEGTTAMRSRNKDEFESDVEWPKKSGNIVPRFKHLPERRADSTP